MTYSLDESVAWAKLPIRVEYWPIATCYNRVDGFFVFCSPGSNFFTDREIGEAARWYCHLRNQLAAYLPPEPKPGQNVDVVA